MIKYKLSNFKKLCLLFIAQVILGSLPVAVFLVYVFYIQRSERFDGYDISIGVIFASVMVLSLLGYTFAAKKYNILVSGYKGEKVLAKIAKKLPGNYKSFTNLPIRYKKNRSELDLLLVGERGVLIVEVKNHSGVIIGSDNAQKWIHRKYYRKGKVTETEMENPFNQIKRQREILKSILRVNGLDVWIDGILFFSGELSLRLRVSDRNTVAASENELIGIICGYRTPKMLTTEECDKIIQILSRKLS